MPGKEHDEGCLPIRLFAAPEAEECGKASMTEKLGHELAGVNEATDVMHSASSLSVAVWC